MKEIIHFGHFSARWLAPLKPFVDYARETEPMRFINGSVAMEPCPEGGAFIIAVTGHCTVVIRDEGAHVTGPCLLDIPDDAFRVAAGPAPIAMSFEGEPYECPLPDWAQPHEVVVSTAGMFITTKMRNPDWAEESDDFQPVLYSKIAPSRSMIHTMGLDYGLTDGMPFHWRPLMAKALSTNDGEAAASEIFFNPSVPGMLAELAILLRDDKGPSISHRFAGGGSGPVLTRFSDHPEIIALWMPMLTRPVADVPSYFLTAAPTPTHVGSEVKQ